jgi:hypothetical protein
MARHSKFDVDKDRHHYIVSERVQRIIKTFPPEDNDEFRISSTGQILTKQDLQNDPSKHNRPETTRHFSKPSSTSWTDVCSTYSTKSKHDAPSTLREQLTGVLCASLPHTNSIYYCVGTVTMTAVIAATLYRYKQSKLASITTTATTTSHTTLASTTHVKCTPKKEVVPLSDTAFRTPKRQVLARNDSAPHLIPEDNADETGMICSAGTSTAVDQPQILTLPRSKQSTPDDANHVVLLVSSFQKNCEKHGIPFDSAIAWKWAMQQQMTDRIIHAQENLDVRRFVYDHSQRTMDRTLSQQQHDENLSAGREDKDWLTKMTNVRDRAYDALVRVVYQSLISIFMVVLAQPVLFMLHLWYTLSTTQLVCYGTGTMYDPTMMIEIKKSSSHSWWYTRYAPTLSYIDSFTTSAVGDAATCVVFTAGRLLFFIGAIVLVYIASWILHQLALSNRIQQVCKSAVLLSLLSTYNWLPKHDLFRMLICLSIIVSVCYCYVSYQFQSARGKFQKLNPTLPQVSHVNEYVSWFDDAISLIHIIPFFAVGGLLFLLW